MLERIAVAYDRCVLGHPRLALLLLGAAFLFFARSAQDFRLDASADSLILESDRDLRVFRELNERYGAREFLFVTFTPEAELFSDASIATIRALREDLKQAPGVESVVSLIDVPLVKIVGGKLSEVARNYRTLEDPAVDREAAREELVNSPVFRELIISADGGTTALLVNLAPKERYTALQRKKNRLLIKRDAEGLSEAESLEFHQLLRDYDAAKTRTDRARHETIAALRAVIDSHRHQGALHLGGVSMIADDMITFIKNDLAVFGAGVFIFLVLMLSCIFRQFSLRRVASVQLRLRDNGHVGTAGIDRVASDGHLLQLRFTDAHSHHVHECAFDRALPATAPGFCRAGAKRTGGKGRSPHGLALSLHRADHYYWLRLSGCQRHQTGHRFRLDDDPGVGDDFPDLFSAVPGHARSAGPKHRRSGQAGNAIHRRAGEINGKTRQRRVGGRGVVGRGQRGWHRPVES